MQNTIKDYLRDFVPGDKLEESYSELIESVTEKILTSLPDNEANKLRNLISSGASSEKITDFLKSSSIDLNEIISESINKIKENN